MSSLSAEDWGAVVLSLRVALAATACALPLAIAAAYAQARGRFPGRVLLDALITLPLLMR